MARKMGKTLRRFFSCCTKKNKYIRKYKTLDIDAEWEKLDHSECCTPEFPSWEEIKSNFPFHSKSPFTCGKSSPFFSDLESDCDSFTLKSWGEEPSDEGRSQSLCNFFELWSSQSAVYNEEDTFSLKSWDAAFNFCQSSGTSAAVALNIEETNSKEITEDQSIARDVKVLLEELTAAVEATQLLQNDFSCGQLSTEKKNCDRNQGDDEIKNAINLVVDEMISKIVAEIEQKDQFTISVIRRLENLPESNASVKSEAERVDISLEEQSSSASYDWSIHDANINVQPVGGQLRTEKKNCDRDQGDDEIKNVIKLVVDEMISKIVAEIEHKDQFTIGDARRHENLPESNASVKSEAERVDISLGEQSSSAFYDWFIHEANINVQPVVTEGDQDPVSDFLGHQDTESKKKKKKLCQRILSRFQKFLRRPFRK